MQIFHSPASPFVRKVMVCAAELGIELERIPAAVGPVARNAEVVAANPLGQVPTVLADDGAPLFDSRVICEVLDAQAGGRLFPPAGPDRWRALTEQALADGVLGGALLARYEEMLRPAELRWPDWSAGQLEKTRCGLDRMEQWAPGLGERVDIGTISMGCALGWLDFRFPGIDWRATCPALGGWFAGFAARPSMVATQPRG